MSLAELSTQFVYEMQRGKKVVKGNPKKMGTPLNYAKSAVHHVRRVLPIRESNRTSNVKRTGGHVTTSVYHLREDMKAYYTEVYKIAMAEWDKTVKALVDKGLDKLYPASTYEKAAANAVIDKACTAASAALGGAGNCGEQSSTAFAHLIKDLNCPYTLERYSMVGGDHAYVVINRPQDTPADDFTKWGDNTAVCDPWYNRAFLGANVKKELRFRKGTPTPDVALPNRSPLRFLFIYAYESYLKLVNDSYAMSPIASSSIGVPRQLAQEWVDEYVAAIVKRNPWLQSFPEMIDLPDINDIIRQVRRNEWTNPKRLNKNMETMGKREQKYNNVLEQLKNTTPLKQNLPEVVLLFVEECFHEINIWANMSQRKKSNNITATVIEELTSLLLDISESTTKERALTYVNKMSECLDRTLFPETEDNQFTKGIKSMKESDVVKSTKETLGIKESLNKPYKERLKPTNRKKADTTALMKIKTIYIPRVKRVLEIEISPLVGRRPSIHI